MIASDDVFVEAILGHVLAISDIYVGPGGTVRLYANSRAPALPDASTFRLVAELARSLEDYEYNPYAKGKPGPAPVVVRAEVLPPPPLVADRFQAFRARVLRVT